MLDKWVTNKEGKKVKVTSKSAVTVVGVVLAFTVVHGGGSGGGGTGSATQPATGQATQPWTRLGLHQLTRQTAHTTDCAATSHGQVHEFFLHTPCRSMDRALLTLSDTKGNTTAVSIAWVQMSTSDTAARLKSLADTNGTGNITPLTNTHFTGAHYHSAHRDTLTVLTEATPTKGHPATATMNTATQIAATLPPP